MKQRIFEIPRKIKPAFYVSFVAIMWMLVAFWTLNGIKTYAFLLLTCLTIVLHGVMGCIYLKKEINKEKIFLVLVAVNVFIFILGMIFSAVFKDKDSVFSMKLTEKQCIEGTTLSEDELNKLRATTPIITTSNTSAGVKISWNAIENVSGYAVFRREKDDFENIIIIMDPSLTTYTDISAKSARNYTYAVCTITDDDMGQCVPALVTSGIWKPTLQVNKNIDDANLHWSSVEGVQGYRVYRKSENTDYVLLEEIQGEENTEYVDNTIEYGVKYTYGVRAFLDDVQSGMVTKEVTFSLVKANLKTESVSSEGKEGVKLTWDAVQNSEGYNVYRKTGNEKYAIIAQVGSEVTEWFDQEVMGETEYSYAVRAKKGEYLNKYTASVVTTEKFPGKEQHILEALDRVTVEVEQQGSKVLLKWNKVENASGYHVYKKIGSEEYVMLQQVEGVDKVNLSDENVETGKSYLYYVCAFIGNQEGPYTGAKIEVK